MYCLFSDGPLINSFPSVVVIAAAIILLGMISSSHFLMPLQHCDEDVFQVNPISEPILGFSPLYCTKSRAFVLTLKTA